MSSILGDGRSDDDVRAAGARGRDGGPTEGEMFDVLSNRRRRFALHALNRSGETVEIGRLAEQIAAWENDVDVAAVTSGKRKRVYTALQQTHLPRMDEAGVVAFDKRAGTVRTTDAAADVDVYLDVVRGREIPWSAYYVGLSALCASILVALEVGVPPLTRFPTDAWFALAVVAFAVSSVAHLLATRKRRLGATDRPPEIE